MAQLNHPNQLAVGLLLVGAGRNYGWLLADPEMRGVASKALGAIAALCLIAFIAYHFASKMVLLVAAFYGFEELQTAVCSVMYMIEPWHVEAGQSMCSARIGFDIGAVGIFVVGLLAYILMEKNMTDATRPQATTIGELDIHLQYMQSILNDLRGGMANMATTDDIKALSERMDKFVTQDRFDALEKKVDNGTIGSSFTRAALLVQRVAGAMAALIALGGIVVAVVHYFDSIKAVI